MGYDVIYSTIFHFHDVIFDHLSKERIIWKQVLKNTLLLKFSEIRALLGTVQNVQCLKTRKLVSI